MVLLSKCLCERVVSYVFITLSLFFWFFLLACIFFQIYILFHDFFLFLPLSLYFLSLVAIVFLAVILLSPFSFFLLSPFLYSCAYYRMRTFYRLNLRSNRVWEWTRCDHLYTILYIAVTLSFTVGEHNSLYEYICTVRLRANTLFSVRVHRSLYELIAHGTATSFTVQELRSRYAHITHCTLFLVRKPVRTSFTEQQHRSLYKNIIHCKSTSFTVCTWMVFSTLLTYLYASS